MKETKHMMELRLANHPKTQELDNILKTIARQGHSGFSINYVKRAIRTVNFHEWDSGKDEYTTLFASHLHELEPMVCELEEKHREDLIALINQDNLTPLTLEDDEWDEVTEMWGGTIRRFQNNRKFSIFKDGVDGRPYSVADIVCIEDNDEVYTRRAFVIDGKEYSLKLFPKDVNNTPDVYVKVHSREEGEEHFVYFKSDDELKKIEEFYDIEYAEWNKVKVLEEWD